MTPAFSRASLSEALRSYGLALLLFLATLLAWQPAHAQLRVDISGTGATQYPIAIADFAGDDVRGRALAEVIRADLTRTGQFRLINAAGSGLTSTRPSITMIGVAVVPTMSPMAVSARVQMAASKSVIVWLTPSRKTSSTALPSRAPNRNCAGSHTRSLTASTKKSPACVAFSPPVLPMF